MKTHFNRRRALPALALLFLTAAVLPLPAASIEISPRAEFGLVGVLSHTYRVGSLEDGNVDFDFVTQGGQDILFPYQRYSVDMAIAGSHRITALYQPLTLTTRSVAARNDSGTVQIDGVDFLNLPIDITYGFDFWRLSYLYDFVEDPATILGVGLSLQIRNASISFTSVDGSKRVVQQNIGPVPIIKVRAAHWLTPSFGLDFEADGFYASSAFFNGSARPFTGWVWDASLSAKTRFQDSSAAYLTVRSIGGGAEGSNAYPGISATKGTNPQTRNVLATMAITLGLSIE